MKSHPNSTFIFPVNVIKTWLGKEKEKTTLSQIFLPKFYKNKTEFKKPLKFTLFKCTKSNLHGFGKELKFYKERFY